MQFRGLFLILSGWLTVISAAPLAASLISDPIGQWIPADTAMVIEVSNARQWSGDFGNNQLGQMLIRFSPANRFILAWQRMQRMLSQTSDQMVDNYFGQSVVLLVARRGGLSPMVLISKLPNRQVALDLIEKLQLELREKFEDHQIFQTPDGGAILSLHDKSPTIILTSQRNTPYLKRLMQAAATEPLLKNDSDFLEFLKQTPQDAVLRGYLRPAKGEKHSFFITNHADAIQAQYVGQTPQIAAIISHLGSNEPHRFGPLPPDYIAALAINLNEQNTQSIKVLDKILAPKTYVTDLQPKLGQSIVLFFNKPKQKQLLPAVGLALQLKDPNLASDMDTFMKNLMVVSTTTLEKQSRQKEKPLPRPIQATLAKHNQTAYRTAQVANIKMIQQGMTVVTPIQLSWGCINNWYVVSSDKQTFCACIDNHDPTKPLIKQVSHSVSKLPGIRVAQLQFKPQILAEHLKRFASPTQPKDKTVASTGSFYRQSPIRLNDICTALKQFSQMSVNVFRDDQNRMIAQVKINRVSAN